MGNAQIFIPYLCYNFRTFRFSEIFQYTFNGCVLKLKNNLKVIYEVVDFKKFLIFTRELGLVSVLGTHVVEVFVC